MGIQGLFQLLKPIIVETNLREFEGQTWAIDMMCWLYKGVYSWSYEIAKNFESFNYLSFPLKMIKILQSFNIKPIWVFDGLHLNAKWATENGRREEKIRNKHKGELLDIQGNHEEAKKFFGKSMVISSKMINLFIEILHKLDIEVIIAPYEADAQISYLCKEGIADFGVSEDSDIVVFGWPTLVCKLQPSGDWSVIRINEIWEKSFKTKWKDKGLLELAQFNHEVFVFVWIMSGCDYLPSIERMGLKTSIKNFVKYKNFKSIMSNLSSHHTFKGKIPKNYVETVLKVRDLFLYQTVYDPITYKCRPLNDIPEGTVVDQNFLGKYIDEDKLPKYVRGWLDKYTFEPREVLDPDVQRIKNAMRDNDITTGTFYYNQLLLNNIKFIFCI